MTGAGRSAEPTETTAVILCGGRGERLRPFTETLPKPLVPLNGLPLLGHLLGWLRRQGVRRFVLCTGYRAEEIERWASANAPPGSETVCVDSGEAAAMSDRLIDARPRVPGRALVCYGDTLANVDLAGLHEVHGRSGGLATMCVYPLRSPFGIVRLAERSSQVAGLDEKPVLPHWINIGYVLCEPAALDLLDRGSDLVAFLRKLAARRALAAHRHRGRHLTVNTEKERAEAESEIEFFTLMEGDVR